MSSIKYIFSCQKNRLNFKAGLLAVLVVGVGLFGVYFKEMPAGFTNLFYESAKTEAVPDGVAGPKPDMYIEKLNVTNTTLKVGQSLELTMKIGNLGIQESGEFHFKVVDENGWGIVEKTTVQAGLYKYMHVSLPTYSNHLGHHTFSVILDSKNEVEEDNEDNNRGEFVVEVGK